MIFRSVRSAMVGLAALAGLAATPALAADYPDRAITMVVPYTPGGATDIIGRVIAAGLQQRLGQSVVVENISGAGGSLGAARVAKAAPDGYTLMLGALTSHSINMNLPPKPNFDLVESFAPVGLAGYVALAIVVHPSVQANTVSELIALAKSQPGKLTYASSGNGSPQHLAGELFNATAGTQILHVPYRGSSPAVTDLTGGQVHMMIDTVPSVLPYVQGGKLRLLAVTTAEPSPTLPDAPTAASQGLKGFDVSSWFGLLAPAGTPEPIIEKLNKAMNEVLAAPETLETLGRQGVNPAPGTPADAAKLIAAQLEKWAAVIKAANVNQ